MIDTLIPSTTGLWCGAALALAASLHKFFRWIGPNFFAPDAFIGRPYGYVTNQMGHFLVMFLALCAIVAASHFQFGYVPYRVELLAAGVPFSFAFQYMQWAKSGGGFFDSVEDAVFMSHGWCAPIFTISLYDNGQPEVIDWVTLGVWLIVFTAHILTGAAVRYTDR